MFRTIVAKKQNYAIFDILISVTDFREDLFAISFVVATFLCWYPTVDDFRVEAAYWILFDSLFHECSADGNDPTRAPRNVG